MRGTRFLVALALICTSSLFAGGPVNDVVSTAGEKASAKHVIQPLDVIQIEMLKVIPKEPYHVGVFDVLQVRANALPESFPSASFTLSIIVFCGCSIIS